MKVLTWGRSNRSEPGHMWLVSQDGLEAEKAAEGNSKTQYWVFDHDIKPALRVDSLDPSTVRVFRNSERGWDKLIDVNLNDDFSPALHATSCNGLKKVIGESWPTLEALALIRTIETTNGRFPSAPIFLQFCVLRDSGQIGVSLQCLGLAIIMSTISQKPNRVQN